MDERNDLPQSQEPTQPSRPSTDLIEQLKKIKALEPTPHLTEIDTGIRAEQGLTSLSTAEPTLKDLANAMGISIGASVPRLDMMKAKPIDFGLTAEQVALAAESFELTLRNHTLHIVPQSLIEMLARGDADPSVKAHATALSFNDKVIQDKRLREDLIWRTSLYLQAHGYFKDGSEATAYAEKMIRPDQLLVAEEVRGTDEEHRLPYHELIHEYFREVGQKGPSGKAIVSNIRSAYLAIPQEQRLRIENAFRSLNYNPSQYQDEFWAYYLSGQVFPSRNPIWADKEFDSLGKSTPISNVTTKLPFLLNKEKISQQTEIIFSNAKRLPIIQK